jgi:hypothetical protein
MVPEEAMVSECKPRKPVREARMREMPGRKPASGEVHAAAHPAKTRAPSQAADMHPSAHAAHVHAASHAPCVHAATTKTASAKTAPAAASQSRRRKYDRGAHRTSCQATNELANHISPPCSIIEEGE